ncbi:DMT family transporter [Aeromicrobium phragmitis]|uniref:DMT family transporter n=1 Tax=Aeromicrobium phragmitis TaxID=2478914 RepID=A0A3L8PJX0_9ACTN|nr:DMT family transporter [Aeromicrobium phragmitis]RLV55655.1 DMT family transporter [Aeromicrobium phragmitis]
MEALLLPAGAVAIGVLLAVQASVNPRLARAVGTPYGGATVQLWVAVALLVLTAVAAGAFDAFGRLGAAPGWYLLGGLASPLYITCGILLFPRIGALAAGGMFVAGQVLGSVALDVFGLLGLERQPATPHLVAGAVLVLAGIGVVVRGQATATPTAALASSAPRGDRRTPSLAGVADGRAGAGWIALGLVAGAALPFQGAVNARLRTVLVDPITVALTSFVVAAVTITLVLAVLRMTGAASPLHLAGVRTMPWWGWLGALCAVLYVTGTFLLIPRISAAVTIVLTVTGQQLAGAVIDARGAFGLPRRPVTMLRALGLALLLGGCLLVELA